MQLRHCLKVSALLIVIIFLIGPTAYAQPNVNAHSALLMDLESGRILYAKNMHQRLSQASTTKITTAVLALEKLDLNKQVRISQHAAAIGEASMGLHEGEILSVKDLLYGLLLQSGNDAAVALAEAVSGSEKKFIREMNQFVTKIGAKNTSYANPHGLDADNHYSTAYDLALITRYALKHPVFRTMASTTMQPVDRQGLSKPQLIKNKNRLLTGEDEYYAYANGVKPGYTSQSGNCLVSSATKGGQSLLAVVLNARDVYGESKNLLEWGFGSFRQTSVLKKGELAGYLIVKNGVKETVPVVSKADLSLPVLTLEKTKIKKQIVLPNEINAPVHQGQWLGQVKFFLEDKQLIAVDLIAAETVEKESYLVSFWQALVSILSL